MMLAGPLIVLENYREYHDFFAVNARFGLALVPGLAILAAWCASRRRGTLMILGAVAVLGAGALLWAFATTPAGGGA
jgi:hypothetical protein